MAVTHAVVRRIRLVGFGLVALAGGIGLAWAEEDARAGSGWVSKDAVVYVQMPGPKFLIDKVADERLRSLLRVFPPFQRGIERAFESPEGRKGLALLKAVETRLGMDWDDALLGLTGRGVELAVEARPGRPPRVFIVADPIDSTLPRRVTDAIVEVIRKEMAAGGGPDPYRDYEHRGVKGHGIGPQAAFAVVRDKLVLADRFETLDMIVDRSIDPIEASRSIESDEVWRARHQEVRPDTLVWGLARLDRLRELDAKRFTLGEKRDIGPTLLFGGWLETFRTSPWVASAITWTDQRLDGTLTVATKGKRPEPYRGFVPDKKAGAPKLALPPGTILSVGLWRDLAALWDARADLLAPEQVQQLAGLDTFAGQFFGGRDFGSGVLGALDPSWRLVVAQQDHAAMTPVPDVKLPAFALVIDLKPDDPEFAQRLKVAFQSFIGLVNIGAAQTKAPPLELGSETFDGLTIATSRFVIPKSAGDDKDKAGKEPVHLRHNFSPSAVQVGDHFVISSGVGLAREMAKTLKGPAGKPEEATLVAEADGATLATLVDLNKTRLTMQNMLDKGNDRQRAEGEISLLAALLRYLGHGRGSIQDGDDATRVRLEFTLGK